MTNVPYPFSLPNGQSPVKHDLSKIGAAVFHRVEAATFTRDDLGSLADFGSERLLGKILDEYAFELS